MQATLIAPDIECEGCAASIQKVLGREAGIYSAAVEVPTKTITLDYDPQAINLPELKEMLAEIGFPPTE